MKIKLTALGLLILSLQTGAYAASCQNVSERLNDLVGSDQEIRQQWTMLEQNAKSTVAEKEALIKRQNAIDDGNLRQIKEIIAACGWPEEKEASHRAWLLAQHADRDIAFQHQARDLLEASVKANIAAPRDLAYLSDRIAANEGRPQEYGTQFTQTDRCHLTLDPIDSIEFADRRRLAIGLPSVEAYVAEGRRRFIPADCPKSQND